MCFFKSVLSTLLIDLWLEDLYFGDIFIVLFLVKWRSLNTHTKYLSKYYLHGSLQKCTHNRELVC